MTQQISLDDVKLLSAFAAEPNLRAAARELGVPRSTVSRHIAELEARLGDDLFLRRGRKLAPTRLGQVAMERARAAALSLEQFETSVRHAAQRRQRLTVATSPLFAELVLPRVLAALLQSHPALGVELRLSHEYSDLFDGQIDVGVRRGPIPDSDALNARRLGRTTLVCVAARGLKVPVGAPEAVAAGLPWIRVGARLEPFSLTLRSGRRVRSCSVMPRLAADSQRLALELVERGAGVARVNVFRVRDQLSRGDLVEVLPEARSVEDVFAVYARRRQLTAPLREFLRLLGASAREMAIWD